MEYPVFQRDENLSADDLATLREGQFLAASLLQQAKRAQAMHVGTPGVCSNCGEGCDEAATYCDALCRNDHDRRIRAAHRSGGAASS